MVRVAFLGDLMIGRDVSRMLAERPPEWFWGDTREVLAGMDAVAGNLETPLTARLDTAWPYLKAYKFRADPRAVEILTAGKLRFVALANNHMLDRSAPGLVDTLEILDAAGIRHAGAGADAAAAAAPALVEAGGERLGFIAATDNMPEFAATAASPGTNYLEIRPTAANLAWIRSAVAGLREAGATLVVLSLHWGPNMRRAPPRRFRAFARAAIDGGVDIVHGHSAHVVHGVERHGHGLILYDTGNFIDDYWKFPFRETVWSFIFAVSARSGRLERLELIPVSLLPKPTHLAQGETAAAIKRTMRAYSQRLGTALEEAGSTLALPLGRP